MDGGIAGRQRVPGAEPGVYTTVDRLTDNLSSSTVPASCGTKVLQCRTRRENVVEILQPGSWSEALELRRAHPEAKPIAGGTDVMVELNFDHIRPAALLDLTRVPELPSMPPGRLAAHRRRRALHPPDRRARRPAARPRRRVPYRRLAPDPQPRHGRGQPRDLLARRRRPAAAVRGRRRGRARVGRRHPSRARGPVHHRPETQRHGRRRADRRVLDPARRRPAGVLEGRHAQRDGDRGLLVRAASLARAADVRPASGRPGRRRSAPPRPRRSSRRARLGDARAASTRRRGLRRAGGGRRAPDRRRPRHRRLPQPRPERARAATLTRAWARHLEEVSR